MYKLVIGDLSVSDSERCLYIARCKSFLLLYRVPGERTTPSEDATNGGAADIEDEQAFAAAPTTNYKIWVTLTDVPVGADDLLVNATVNRGLAVDEKLVTNPSEGDVVKFDFKVPKGGAGIAQLFAVRKRIRQRSIHVTFFRYPLKVAMP